MIKRSSPGVVCSCAEQFSVGQVSLSTERIVVLFLFSGVKTSKQM